MSLKELLKRKIQKLDGKNAIFTTTRCRDSCNCKYSDEKSSVPPELAQKQEDEEFRRLSREWGKDPTQSGAIPRFYNRIPNENEPLRQKLREESRSNLLKQKSLQLLTRTEMNDLWVLLDAHHVTDEQLISYADFQVMRPASKGFVPNH